MLDLEKTAIMGKDLEFTEILKVTTTFVTKIVKKGLLCNFQSIHDSMLKKVN